MIDWQKFRVYAAYRFVLTWKLICAKYGRRTFTDYRVQYARRQYSIARWLSP